MFGHYGSRKCDVCGSDMEHYGGPCFGGWFCHKCAEENKKELEKLYKELGIK